MFTVDMNEGQFINTRFKAGKKWRETKIIKEGNRLFLSYGYSPKINEEIKSSFTSYKYHGFDEINPRKVWSVLDCQHNWFQIAFLTGQNPYDIYDAPLINHETERPLYEHQIIEVQHCLTRHYCILAVEMGCGKTLAAIEVMETAPHKRWLWVGPKSAIAAVKLEFKNWRCKFRPQFSTYRGLTKLLAEWDGPAPFGIIFDECSRLKNSTTQQAKAARLFSDNVRKEHGWDGFVIGMSGSPAPKSPLDWWSQCETVQPGFVKEGMIQVFKNRLAIIEQRESLMTGSSYPHLMSWRDDKLKCNVCGEYEKTHTGDHLFEKSVNEVSRLYIRMRGLVLVQFKKDCLDLPEKQYRVIKCEPKKDTLRAAEILGSTITMPAKLLIHLRELSDGFQYVETATGEEKCSICKGSRTIKQWDCLVDPDEYNEILTNKKLTHEHQIVPSEHPELFKQSIAACPTCNGTGKVVSYVREAQQIPCPKEDALKDIIDEHLDIGRIVTYAGFTGSVDRVTSIFNKSGWSTIRVDGRGWFSDIGGNPEGLLEVFQNQQHKHPKVAFIGQPGAAGMGLTLTASPTIVYYSNDFNAESRIQSEDRIHRPGMDTNRGATIIDLFHLPTDEYVLMNLKKKRDLQSLSLGEIRNSINELL